MGCVAHNSQFTHDTTKVTAMKWDEGPGMWTIRTDKDDCFRARYVIMNFGTFTQPKLPGMQCVNEYAALVLAIAHYHPTLCSNLCPKPCPTLYRNFCPTGVPGLGSFKGHMFHTSRWDYGYTGGSSLG